MQNEQLLQKINSPADLKMLTLDEMKLLAGEIRQLIIDVVSKNGGHLAPNLGVVELTWLCIKYLRHRRIKLSGT